MFLMLLSVDTPFGESVAILCFTIDIFCSKHMHNSRMAVEGGNYGNKSERKVRH